MTDTLVHTVREGLRLTFSVDGSVFEMTRDERENIFAIVDSIRAMGRGEPEPVEALQIARVEVADSVAVSVANIPEPEPEPEPAPIEPEPGDQAGVAGTAVEEPQRPAFGGRPRNSVAIRTMSPDDEAKWIEQMVTPVRHGTAEAYEAGCRCGPCREAVGEHVHHWRMDSPKGQVVSGECSCGARREDPSDLTPRPGAPKVSRSKVEEAPARKSSLWKCSACGHVTSNRYVRKHREEQCPALAGEMIDLGEAS